MRINIVLDVKLVEEAFQYASVSNIKELVEIALLEYIENHQCRDIRELQGKVKL